ncbi:MAG TPA: CDGSH iron-sulfur domain-containing protein [Bacteroidota bacterium]|jgi:CDGSH-type Zn-finger protein|nr:CDGSH iron-sulfur domain-containing protein [Bacteroidota bacterium]
MATIITVKNNSSIRIEGDFEMYDQNGNKYDLAGRTRLSLCRCGQSQDKPFCDSTHKKINFQSEVIAHALPPPQPKL